MSPADSSVAAADASARALSVRGRASYSVRTTNGVVYGRGTTRASWTDARFETVDLLLDVYEPENAPPGPRPAVVAIHGGGFSGGTRADTSMVAFARFFAERGFVAFSIDYRLQAQRGLLPADWPAAPAMIPADQWRAMYPAARDTQAALRFVHANAARYGTAEDSIASLGGSAGSFLAVLVGAADPADYRDELTAQQDPTLATTNLAARSDVRAVVNHWGGLLLLDALRLRDGRNRVGAGDAPLSTIHGRQDTTVPFSQAEALQAAWTAASLPFEFHPFDGEHGAWSTRIDGQPLTDLAFAFVTRRLGLTVVP